jgi:hypothetical protein
MTIKLFTSSNGVRSFKAILSALTLITLLVESSGFSSSDHIRFSRQVQNFVANDDCAKKAATDSASEAFNVISDLGVDWPDYIEVSEISRDFVDQKTVYRIITQGLAFSFNVLNKDNCILSAASRLLTIQQDVKWQNHSMNIAFELGRDYLGEEFFGAANIGGAHTFVVDDYEYNNSIHTPQTIVQQYYKEWHGLDVDLVLESDKSKANIEKILREILGVEAIDDSTRSISEKLNSNIFAALEGNPTFVLLSGNWSAPGIGDPSAGFLAIVAPRSGKVLILEQGFVD